MHIITKIISSKNWKKEKQTSRKAHQKIHFIIFGFAEKLLSLFCTAWTREIYNVSIQLHIHTKNRIIKAKQKHTTTTYPRKLCLQWPWSCHQTSPYELRMSKKFESRIFEYRNVHKSKPIFVMTRVFFNRSLHQTTSLSYKKTKY